MTHHTRSQIEQALRWVTMIVGTGFFLLFIYVASRRIAYPFELKWMEGLTMEHIARVMIGSPIYDRPSIEFVAMLYQPLHYYVFAAWSTLFGLGFSEARALSAICTILSTALIARITFTETARSSYAAFISAALFLAAYAKLGYFFDVVRLDSIFTLLILMSVYAALYLRGQRRIAVMAVLLVLCYFTKQQSLLFIAPLLVWFAMEQKAHALWTALLFLLIAAVITLFLQRASDGWYLYYVYELPSYKTSTFSAERFLLVFLAYAGVRWSPMIIAGIWNSGRLIKRKLEPKETLLMMMFFAGLLAGALGLGNEGGDKNVLMQLAAFGPIVMMLVLREASSLITSIAVLLQFALLAYNPMGHALNAPGKADIIKQQQWMDELRQVQGEVWLQNHGYVAQFIGKRGSAGQIPLGDVLLGRGMVADSMRHELDLALASHHFAAIVADEPLMLPQYRLRDSAVSSFASRGPGNYLYYYEPIR